MLPPRPDVRTRIAALAPRERGFLAAGIIALLLFWIYLSVGEEAVPSVELVQSPTSGTPPAQPPPAAAPAVVPPPMVAAPSPPLVLHGVSVGGPGGGAAVIGLPGGGQRNVRVGRPVMPGTILVSVGRDHVVLDQGGAPMRLAFGRAAEPASSLPGPTAELGSPTGSTLDYRLALKPASQGQGYIVGQTQLPLLQQAGLQPGDLILSVNGSRFDEERLLELSWQAANSSRIEFEYMRGGKKMNGVIEKTKRVTPR